MVACFIKVRGRSLLTSGNHRHDLRSFPSFPYHGCTAYTATGWPVEAVVAATESNLSVIPIVTQCIRTDPCLSQLR